MYRGLYIYILCMFSFVSLMEVGDKNIKIISDIGYVFLNFWLMKIFGIYS